MEEDQVKAAADAHHETVTRIRLINRHVIHHRPTVQFVEEIHLPDHIPEKFPVHSR